MKILLHSIFLSLKRKIMLFEFIQFPKGLPYKFLDWINQLIWCYFLLIFHQFSLWFDSRWCSRHLLAISKHYPKRNKNSKLHHPLLMWISIRTWLYLFLKVQCKNSWLARKSIFYLECRRIKFIIFLFFCSLFFLSSNKLIQIFHPH